MKQNIQKAYAISDAKISYVSLVDKAANRRQFLITKAEDGQVSFQSVGRILKADTETHQVTGIVYEPMVEDTDGNYMTEVEIEKAAHWFMKNKGDVDIQHSFEKKEGVEIVESSVTKAEQTIEDNVIRKGTWLMTMEINDPEVWEAIEKGQITGFSMGGLGVYDDNDVDLSELEKAGEPEVQTLFQKFAKALGYEAVKKGAVKDSYNVRIKGSNFWNAFYAMTDILEGYHWNEELNCYTWEYETDESKIREALRDFCDIAESILIAEDPIVKSIEKAEKPTEVKKAGRTISAKNLETLSGISTSLSDFVASFSATEDDAAGAEAEAAEDGVTKSEHNPNEGGKDMTKSEVETLVTEKLEKSLKPITDALAEITKGAKAEEPEADPNAEAKVTKEATPEDVSEVVAKAVDAALEPIKQQLDVIKNTRALPSSLNDTPEAKVEKSEEHYLHGIL